MPVYVSMRIAVGLTVALILVMLTGAERPVQAQAAKPGASPCDIQTTERVVAVGDIHGAFDNFVAILRAAQVIDNRNRLVRAGGQLCVAEITTRQHREPERPGKVTPDGTEYRIH